MIWKHQVTPEQINLRSQNTAVSYLDILITEVGNNYLKGTMPVCSKTVQPHRILHGGISCVLAETLGSIASNLLLESSQVAVGQSITANHIRPAKEGSTVTGIAKIIHQGRKSHLWNIEIFDEQDKLICTSNLTMAIIEKSS